MHFLLIGATGRTGQHVVTEVLAQGHTATVLVRDASKITSKTGLTIATGTPVSKDDIRAAIKAGPTPSGAIFTLNAPRKSDSPFAAPISPPRLLSDSCANVCEVLSEAGISRIVVMSTVGTGDSWANLPLVSKAFLGYTNVKYALRDHNMLDEEIRRTTMSWTLVRAVRLEYDDPKKSAVVKDVQTLDAQGRMWE